MTHQQLHETVPWIEIDGVKWYKLKAFCRSLNLDQVYVAKNVLHESEMRQVDGCTLVLPPSSNHSRRMVAVINDTAIFRLVLHGSSNSARQLKSALCEHLKSLPTSISEQLAAIMLSTVEGVTGYNSPILVEDVILWRQMRADGMSLNQVATKVDRSRGTIATYTKNGPHLPKNIQNALRSLEQELTS